MSSAEAQRVYQQTAATYQPSNGPGQEGFAQQFDLRDPDQAMSSYQRVMHEHTKQQFDLVARSARRRSSTANGGGGGGVASLPSDRSRGSISSTSS